MFITRTSPDRRVLARLSRRGCETIRISFGHHGHEEMQRRGGAIVAPHTGLPSTCTVQAPRQKGGHIF
jgi:hypothetical protein